MGCQGENMALTTESAAKLSDLTRSTGSPSKRTIEADILFDKSVVAKPLNAPEVASIHVKNVEYYYRWVNYKHSNGQVYAQRKAMGFVNATTDDVQVLVGDTVANESEIKCGDVILMKIDFGLWASHVKRNMQTAEILQRQRGIYNSEEELSQDVFAEKSGRGLRKAEHDMKGKIGPFEIPNADAIIDGQSASDAETVREQVNEIRKGIREGKPARPAPKE